jgi:hypothetical protein
LPDYWLVASYGLMSALIIYSRWGRSPGIDIWCVGLFFALAKSSLAIYLLQWLAKSSMKEIIEDLPGQTCGGAINLFPGQDDGSGKYGLIFWGVDARLLVADRISTQWGLWGFIGFIR